MTKRRLILLSLMILAITCASVHAAESPKNVIVLIGDGMGIGPVTLTRLSLDESDPPLNMDTMRYAAFLKTHSANVTVTDSAAAASALATGFKTNNGMVSTLPDGRQVQTILEAAEKLGKSTGLVTTTTITHATPAAFGAHVEARKNEADIALQYIEKQIEVLFGGGRIFFIPKSQEQGRREDDRDLVAEAKAAGYAVLDDREDMLLAGGSKLLGLFQMGPLTAEAPEPSLAAMTEKAIATLSADEDGFFLLVEGGQIDWKCHDNDVGGTVRQVLDFDSAIGKALDFARKQGDTLVIVTADHDTGGLSIVYPEAGSDARFRVVWTTKGHTGCSVPLFADGPGADSFTGVLDNTDVPKRIARLWGIGEFAAPGVME